MRCRATLSLVAFFIVFDYALSFLVLHSSSYRVLASQLEVVATISRVVSLMALTLSLLVVLAGSANCRARLGAALAVRFDRGALTLLAASLSAAVVVTVIVLELVRGAHSEGSMDVGVNTLPAWFQVGGYLLALVLGPLVEELVFRGVIRDEIAASSESQAATVCATTLLFVLYHASLGWLAFLAPAVLGGLAGIAREETRSVGTCILIHALWNTTVSVTTMAW